ncbi:LacI family DNA-binding transcriptional regulator [Paenibacillus sp. HB172176]|uniref:LacI family DNA-binding transcriptional regulator n=1 Tax=Paenibacillus sp. HB172176 TaxID=2493690 RepID=UPI00143888F4|nr:LacI family DNA-binding transcriptional regulator [Paenibacillus sp. HB172176]
MVTIKDIAEQAGVSFSTVSKALRDSPLVKPGTKAHILAIAKAMGYQPNLAARSLVSKRSGAIGIVWPSIERAALSSLITKLSKELELQQYVTLLSISNIRSAIETFRRYQLDAILIFGDQNLTSEDFEMNSLHIPILTYGAAGYSPHSAVDVNRGQAIRLAVRHLTELGHRDIAYVGIPHSLDPLQAVKAEAFREELLALGLPFRDSSILRMEGLDFHDGYTAARTMLEGNDGTQRPTAIISGGIDLTRGILRAAGEQGLQVPRDLSIVSYDNLPQMESLEVPVTAVGVAISSIADIITATLLELIDCPDEVKTVYLEPELIVRASTARPIA